PGRAHALRGLARVIWVSLSNGDRASRPRTLFSPGELLSLAVRTNPRRALRVRRDRARRLDRSTRRNRAHRRAHAREPFVRPYARLPLPRAGRARRGRASGGNGQRVRGPLLSDLQAPEDLVHEGAGSLSLG